MQRGLRCAVTGTISMALLMMSGCGSGLRERDSAMQKPEQNTSADHTRLHHYHPGSSDAPWLAKAAEFHGHIGPWVVVGAMIGNDALDRLGSRGQWDIEVICWMPPARQRPPFSCILDGLQSSSGATMGKQNIRMDFDPAVVTSEQPVVFVFERDEKGTAVRGYRYDVADALAAILARSQPDIIEAVSRDIAGHPAGELFVIHPLSRAELDRLKPNNAASSGRARHD